MKKAVLSKKYYIVLAAAVFLLLCLAGCGSGQVRYQITVTGTAGESGVISYLGYEMNVYEDEASNPAETALISRSASMWEPTGQRWQRSCQRLLPGPMTCGRSFPVKTVF